jgi:hypothetical protein
MRTSLVASLLVSVATFVGCADKPAAAPAAPPNLNGVWQVLTTANWDIQDHEAHLGIPPGQGVVDGNELPYLPEALAQKQENYRNREQADPVTTKGYLPGVPRMMYLPFPFHITQTPKYIAIVSEYSPARRIIYTDGSRHPEGHIDFWMGDSRGHWEGDTLVVDVIHFNPDTWFDHAGNFHTDALHLVERFTPAGPDHILYEVTVEDPKVFSKPWKMRMPLYRRKEANVRVLEYEAGALLDEEMERGESRTSDDR